MTESDLPGEPPPFMPPMPDERLPPPPSDAVEPFPSEPPPLAASPGRPSGRGGALKAVLALAVAAALGVAAYFVFFGNDDDTTDRTAPATTSGPDATAPLVVPPSEDLAVLQSRIAELEAALAAAEADPAGGSDDDVADLQRQLGEALARAEEAETRANEAEARASEGGGSVVIDPLDAIVSSIVSVFRVTWGDAVVCTGLDSCAGVAGPSGEFYVDFDPEAAGYRMVMPGVVVVPLTINGLNLTGTGNLVDSGWVCPTDGLTSGGIMNVTLFPASIQSADGQAAVASLAGEIEMLLDTSTACPPLNFEWSISAERVAN